jgi:hypothetical protein
MAIGNSEFSELLSATVQKIEKTLVDQVMTSHPTLDLFKKNVKSATGTSVIVPVAATLGSTTQTDSSGNFTSIAGVDSAVVGNVKYDWAKPLVSKVRVAWSDLQQNSGPEAVVSLAKAHLDSAIGGHAKYMAEHLHYRVGNGGLVAGHFLTLDQIVNVGNPADANVGAAVGVGKWNAPALATATVARASTGVVTLTLTGNFVDANGTALDQASPAIVGSLMSVSGLGRGMDGVFPIASISYATSVTTVTYATTNTTVIGSGNDTTGKVGLLPWSSTRKYIPATGDGGLDIFQAFRSVSNDIFVASGKRPNAIVCGRDVYEEYENKLDENVRYTQLATAESRFQELKFDGMAVRLDPDAPTKRAYFLNEDALIARYLNSNFMKVMEAQVVPNTLDTITPLATVLAFGTNERRAHGVLIRATGSAVSA